MEGYVIKIEGANYFLEYTTDSFSTTLIDGYRYLKTILVNLGNTYIYLKFKSPKNQYVRSVYIEESDKFNLKEYIEEKDIPKHFLYVDSKELLSNVKTHFVSLSELRIFTDKEVGLLTTLYHNTLKDAKPVLDIKYYSSIIAFMKKHKGYARGKIEGFNEIEKSISALLLELDKIKKLDNKFGFKNEIKHKPKQRKNRKNT